MAKRNKNSPIKCMPIGQILTKLRAVGGREATMSPYAMAIEVLEKHGISTLGTKANRLRRALKVAGYVDLNGKNPSLPTARKSKDKAKLLPVSKPSVSLKTEFYGSWEWRTLRMQVLKEYGAVCQCCGASKGGVAMGGAPVRIVVDHIKPLSKYWDLRLERSNLQVLCDECNQGKGAWDETDHR